ncbi:MAG: hypothetical protein WA999_08600, partial [Spirulinaceae cyanobacterium]
MRSLLKHKYFPIIIALLGGIMMGLTPAPIEAYGLAWVALIPLWLVTQTPHLPPSPSPCLPILPALSWGFGYHG